MPAGKKGPTIVEAKKWSKVNGKIKLSDWTKFSAVTIDGLPAFTPVTKDAFSKYGGDTSARFLATGYFYTHKVENRWWIIDPDGYASWHVGVSGIRPGSSERNNRAMATEFGTAEKWAVETCDNLTDLGFNGSGCWSDIPLMRYSNQKNDVPLSYTMIWNFYSGYARLKKKNNPGGPSFPVFDPGFADYCDQTAIKLEETNQDPNLLGHFSDNEIAFSDRLLDEYLAINDPDDMNYQAAINWLGRNGLAQRQLTDTVRNTFAGFAADKYYKVVSGAIRKHDPNHMYLGSRLHGKPKHNKAIVQAAGRYADIISINYYGQWDPAQKHFTDWSAWVDKPIIITEFYTKGEDSGLANISGAGWTVKTQNDRGLFYENFCISLLQMNNCVGWHWFRYMDNDPADKTADPSNNDSNKGIVDNDYKYYVPLTDHMRLLNLNRYKLIKYFRKKEVIG
jgi:hypothetical protein